MFKKVLGGIGRTFKPLVNFSAWMGWKSLKEDNQKLGRLAKELLVAKKVEVRPETFEEAVIRLNLNESMLIKRQQYLKRLSIVYAIVALAVFGYAVYLLLFLGAILGFVMTLVVMWVVLALAFKQHFWYIQMRERRLGLSLKEWFYVAFINNKRVKV